MKAVNVEVPNESNFEDVSQTTVALSYNGLMSRVEEPDSEESEIKKGAIFGTLLE